MPRTGYAIRGDALDRLRHSRLRPGRICGYALSGPQHRGYALDGLCHYGYAWTGYAIADTPLTGYAIADMP